MWNQIIGFIDHWFESTTPARKVADVAVAFIIAILAGGLYVAWNAEGDIRRLAVKALDKMPELDRNRAVKLSDPLLSDVMRAGGVAVACFKVNLAENTTALVFYKGPEQFKEKFPRLKLGLEKQPFVFSEMPESQLSLASAMLTGVAEVTYHEPTDTTFVAVPIPDRSGAFLAGIVMVAIPNKHDDGEPVITNLRLLLSDFSRSVL